MSKKVIKNNNRNFIPTAENPYTTKKGELKWSFWVVLALMVFWSVGAVLGIFATARSCNDSASVKIVSAEESYDNPLVGSIIYNGEKFFTSDFTGLGCTGSSSTSNIILSFEYNLTSSNCVYFISQSGKIPGDLKLVDSSSGNSFSFDYFYEGEPGLEVYYYYISGLDSSVTSLVNIGAEPGSCTIFTTTVIITSGLPFNKQLPVLYVDGTLGSICSSIGSSTGSSDSQSLGFFTGGTFRLANRNISVFDTWLNNLTSGNYSGLPYSSLPFLPSEFVVPFHNGILNSFKFQVIETVCGSSIKSSQFLFCDFGDLGKSFGDYKVFSVFVKQNNSFSPAEDYNISFIFTDGSTVNFLSSSGGDIPSSSYIDLTNYLNKRVRSVMWVSSDLNSYVVGLSSDSGDILGYNSGYQNGFNAGESQGFDNGYKSGYSLGLSEGKAIGYNHGVSSANNYSFLGLFGAVVDAPITALSGLLNFDLLGFNMLNFFYALCTCALVIAVVRMIL